MKYEIEATQVFRKWLATVKDARAQKDIATRLTRAQMGNLGDAKPVGGGVSEMRITTGKGYRVYFTIIDHRLVLLLNGGIKSNKSQQQRDILLAQQIMQSMED